MLLPFSANIQASETNSGLCRQQLTARQVESLVTPSAGQPGPACRRVGAPDTPHAIRRATMLLESAVQKDREHPLGNEATLRDHSDTAIDFHPGFHISG